MTRLSAKLSLILLCFSMVGATSGLSDGSIIVPLSETGTGLRGVSVQAVSLHSRVARSRLVLGGPRGERTIRSGSAHSR